MILIFESSGSTSCIHSGSDMIFNNDMSESSDINHIYISWY